MSLKSTAGKAKLYQLNLEGGSEEVKVKKPRKHEEEDSQALLIDKLVKLEQKYPCLKWTFATLNGLFLPPPIKRTAVKIGLKKGILDLWFPWRRDEPSGRVIPGLALDMKIKTGTPTPEQLEWAQMLVSCGWRVYFPTSAQEAWWILCSYVGIVGADHYAEELEIKEINSRTPTR